MWRAQRGIPAEMSQSSTPRTCKRCCLSVCRKIVRTFDLWMGFPNAFVLEFTRHLVCVFYSCDELVLRFEAPDSRNRWDSPLFAILKDDALPFEAISDAILKRKAPAPNQSTQSVREFGCRVIVHFKCPGVFLSCRFPHFSLQQPLSSTNFMYELDKITQDVLMVCLRLPLDFLFIRRNLTRCFSWILTFNNHFSRRYLTRRRRAFPGISFQYQELQRRYPFWYCVNALTLICMFHFIYAFIMSVCCTFVYVSLALIPSLRNVIFPDQSEAKRSQIKWPDMLEGRKWMNASASKDGNWRHNNWRTLKVWPVITQWDRIPIIIGLQRSQTFSEADALIFHLWTCPAEAKLTERFITLYTGA